MLGGLPAKAGSYEAATNGRTVRSTNETYRLDGTNVASAFRRKSRIPNPDPESLIPVLCP